MPEYLLILTLLFCSAAFLEWKYRIILYHSRKERLAIPLVFFVIGAVWDNFAAWRGHWNFPGTGITGIFIGFIPLEEYLFILLVPYFTVTIYKVLEIKFHGKK